MSDPKPMPIRALPGRAANDDTYPPSVPWPALLRALREARGLTQGGWAAQLGVSDVTVRRWERGAAVPTAAIEAALVSWCRDQRLFRGYDSGPLRGLTLTPEVLSEQLAEARLGARPGRGRPGAPPALTVVAPAEPEVLPARAAGAPASARLPATPTSLVGRETELAFVRSLVHAGRRLVTVTGPGGAGKTRLAIESARRLAGTFPDGTCFVDLAPLTDPALVPRAVATLFDVNDAPGRSLERGIAAAIGEQHLLLIFDNCEHVVDAAAALAAALLQACPNAALIATSRQPLHVAGEQIYPLPALAVPAPPEPGVSGAGVEPGALLDAEAVRLFVDRAGLVRPDFALTVSNARAVAELCRRLDGLPLAIELAAARVHVLSPEQIVARLGDRFRLVAGGHGTVPRHHTLGALIDWSYNLLTEPEQTLLRRLSVFRGGCTLEAVEHVGGGDGIEATDVLELVLSLVEKSLVVTDFPRGEARYRLLESVREYAAAGLGERDEAIATQHRHADWCLAFANGLEAGTHGSPHQERLDAPQLVVEEFDNLRAAFEWCLADGKRPAAALALANALWWFWPYHTLVSEGRSWYERSLAAAPEREYEGRTHALAHAGWLAFLVQEYETGAALARRAVEQARQHDLPVLAARALRALALNDLSRYDFAAAQADLEEAVALMRAVGQRGWLAVMLDTLGFVFVCREEIPAARRVLDEALPLALAEGLEVVAASSYLYMGMCCSAERDVRGALEHYVEAFERSARVGHRNGPALVIAALALSVLVDGRPIVAAQMLGIWQRQSELLGINAPPRNRGHIEQGLKAIRALVGNDACEAALITGRSMSWQEVQSFIRAAALPDTVATRS